jgi:hypothetical protein
MVDSNEEKLVEVLDEDVDSEGLSILIELLNSERVTCKKSKFMMSSNDLHKYFRELMSLRRLNEKLIEDSNELRKMVLHMLSALSIHGKVEDRLLHLVYNLINRTKYILDCCEKR